MAVCDYPFKVERLDFWCFIHDQALLSELVGQVSATEGLRRELDIVQDLENKSSGKLKYYMRVSTTSLCTVIHAAIDAP